MAIWKQVTDSDGSSTIVINMDNVTHMTRRRGDQTTTIFFVSGAGNELYVTVKDTPEEILMAQPLRSF
jgi:hypothetical protein